MAEPSGAWSLTPSQRTALQALGLVMEDHDSPPSTPEVRDRFQRLPPYGESDPTVYYEALRDLDAAGYITKTPDPSDARCSLLGLTVAGENALHAYANRATAAIGIQGVNAP